MKRFAIIITCCAFALALGLAGCSAASPSSSDDAAAKQATEAQAALDEGIGYWFGTGENGYDKEKARAAFQKAADLGNAEGWYWLGTYTGTATSPDRFAQQADYYQKAIDGGCAKGYCGLGNLSTSGAGTEKDPAKAQGLYQQAVDAGELYGNLGLGNLYKKGEGVEASGAKAVELYEKALASEDYLTRNAARCNLGGLYRTGAEGLDADPAKAVAYFQAAADESFPSGWGGLGAMYTTTVADGDFSIEEDYDKVFECYSKAAEGGYYVNLGLQYENGQGCEQDYGKAVELYRKEVDEGMQPAAGMACLADMYANGRGVEKDFDVAADWCNKALAAAAPDDVYTIRNANKLLEEIASNS